MKRARMKASSFAVPGRRAYPVTSMARARSAIVRVRQHGSPSDKRAVYAKVRSRYPALAKRSTVVPTRGGSGRHHGQPVGTRNTRRR